VAGLENPALENPAMGNGSAEMPPDNAVMDNTAIANLSNTGGLEGGNNIFNNSAGTKATNGAATGANGTALQNPAAASANSAAGTGNPTGTNTIAPPPNNAVPMVANASPLPINLPQGNGTSTGSTSAPVEPPAPPPPAKPNYKVVTEEELALWRQAAEKLRTLAPGEHPAEYTVQPGDTLWDICDQFLDDPYWWPKLWTMNPDISNPNIIEPGQKLVFESSSGTEPPQLAVRDIGKAESIPIDSKFVTQSGGNTWHPWMEKANILLDASEIPTDPTIESYGSIIPPTAFTIATPGYLSSSSPDDVGKIVPAGESILISSKSRVAFGEMDNPPAAGERFIAVRRMPHVPGPTGWPIGGPDLYYYTAILGAVKNHKSGLTEFVVEDTPFDGAAPDDLLIPYKNIYQFIEPAQTGRTATVQAEVVATASSGGRMATLGTVVFLERDEGTTAPGDDIELYMPVAGIVGFDNPGSLDGHLAARARVLEVTEDSIAAVIIATKREVSIGARTWPEF
jgi:nucleoid-associated protein YgaU